MLKPSPMKTNNAANLSATYTVIETKFVSNPLEAARLQGSFLAADHLLATTIVRVNARTVDMVATGSNRAVRYSQRLSVVR